jgi:hypothetical protein
MNTYAEFVSFLCNGLIHRSNIAALSEMLERKPHAIDIYANQLEEAITLFNKHLHDNSLPNFCINARFTQKVLKETKLPTFAESMNDLINSSWQVEFLEELNKFEFIDNLDDLTCLLGRLLVASYRTYLLIKHPYLRDQNVQLASTIEEMVCLITLDGNVTNLFYAIKHWIVDYEKEGFSKELAKRIEGVFA